MNEFYLTPEHGQAVKRAGGIEFVYWLAIMGKSRPTGYRWRRKGMIETVNVEGKLFVLDEEIARFWRRAQNGEFAKGPRGAAVRKRKMRKSRHEGSSSVVHT